MQKVIELINTYLDVPLEERKAEFYQGMEPESGDTLS